MRELVDLLLDAATFEATGELVGVEDGVATLAYEMKGTLAIDDLLALIQNVAPPGELDELPPGIESGMNVTVELTGKGLFDLGLGQLTSLELGGAFTMDMNAAAEAEGSEMSMEMVMAGSFAMRASLEAL